MPSRPTLRRSRARAAARTLLLVGAWVLGSVLAAGAALVLVPGPTFSLLVVSIVASGAGLLLVGGAVVVVVLAAAAAAVGATRSSASGPSERRDALDGPGGGPGGPGRRWTRWGLAVPVALAVGSAVVGVVATVAQVRDARGVEVVWSGYPGGTGATPHDAVRAPSSTEVYATVDGQDLLADVWLPPGAGRGGGATGGGGGRSDADGADGTGGSGGPGARAAVVRVHGGSWSSGRRGAPAWDSALAGAGAVVVEVDYRLAGAVDGEPWRAQPRDVACAVAWVGANAERLGVDPARIVVMGDSAGAHLALLAAYAPGEFPPSCPLDPVRPAAVIALYPPTEMVSLQRSGGWRYPDVLPGDGVLDLMGARPEEAAAAYRTASPLTHVAPGVPPTLVVHGDHDQVVPVGQSRALVAALERAGAEHAHVELAFANHGFDQVWGAVTTQHARAAVLAWVDRA